VTKVRQERMKARYLPSVRNRQKTRTYGFRALAARKQSRFANYHCHNALKSTIRQSHIITKLFTREVDLREFLEKLNIWKEERNHATIALFGL
jgi:hypothetical protein